MVLVKMLMEIDPLPMRGSLVMTMAMISPSRREVSPAEQLCRRPRLVPPRGGGVSSRELPSDFSSDERLHIEEDGQRTANMGPRGRGARPGGRVHPPPFWMAGGPPLVLSSPIFFYIFQKYSPWSFRTFGVVQNRSLIFAPFPAQNSSCQHSPSSCKPYKIREKGIIIVI